MGGYVNTTTGEMYLRGIVGAVSLSDGTPTTPSFFRTEPDPTVAPTPTLVVDGTGVCTNGSHVFAYTYVTNSGETSGSPVSAAVTVDGTHTKVSIDFTAGTAWGFGGDGNAGQANSGGINIYASKANTTTPLFLVATSPVSASTVGAGPSSPYVLNIADGSFTVTTLPTTNTTDDDVLVLTANGGLSIGGKINASGHATAIGVGANANYNSGSFGVAIGAGAVAENVSVAIGTSAFAGALAGVAVGVSATAGTKSLAIGDLATSNVSTGGIALGRLATTTADNQFVAGSSASGASITDVYIGNGVTTGAPSAITYHATGGSGADITGAAISIASGQGTGAGLGGDIKLRYAPHTGSSSTLNALADAFVINGDTGVVKTFKNITTAGHGVPAIYGENISSTQTGNFTALTYTPPATAGRYEVSAVITTTSSTNTGTTQLTVDYVDSQGTTHTGDIIPLCDAAGALATTKTGASKEFHSLPWKISINNAATNIVVKVVVVGSVSYTVSPTLKQVA